MPSEDRFEQEAAAAEADLAQAAADLDDIKRYLIEES